MSTRFEGKVVLVAGGTGGLGRAVTLASSLHKNRMTRAISSGFGHFAKSACGMALRLASVSMILGRTVFARTPLPFKSAASESSSATAADFEAA